MLNITQCLICSDVAPGIGPAPEDSPIITFLLNVLNVIYYLQFIFIAILIIYIAVKLIKAAIRYKNRSKYQTMPYIKMLRALREENYKTQQEIAYILGISQTAYARYESGANEMPVRHLIVLCKYYKVSADHFLGLNSSDQS